MHPFSIKTKKTWLLNSYSIEYTSPNTGEKLHFMHVPGNMKLAEFLKNKLNWAYSQGSVNTLVIGRK